MISARTEMHGDGGALSALLPQELGWTQVVRVQVARCIGMTTRRPEHRIATL